MLVTPPAFVLRLLCRPRLGKRKNLQFALQMQKLFLKTNNRVYFYRRFEFPSCIAMSDAIIYPRRAVADVFTVLNEAAFA